MKRKMALMLCGLMVLSLAACGTEDEASLIPVPSQAVIQTVEKVEEIVEKEYPTFTTDIESFKLISKSAETEETTQEGLLPGVRVPGSGEVAFEKASYVLIYNPALNGEAVSIEAIENQFSIPEEVTRGVVTLPENTKQVRFVEANEELVLKDVDWKESSKKESDPIYAVDGGAFFYCYNAEAARESQLFICRYEGEHCYIWTLNGETEMNDKTCKQRATYFDQKVYPVMTKQYGEPRFTDMGGKVNILMYDLGTTGQTGIFSLEDFYSSAEITEKKAAKRGYNTDHAIINIDINGSKAEQELAMTRTLQQMIETTNRFRAGDVPVEISWVDDVLAVQADEDITSGYSDKYGDGYLFYNSGYFRNGGSLLAPLEASGSAGETFGAAYILESYLKDNAGKEFFGNLRTTRNNSENVNLSDAEILYSAVSEDFRQKIADGYYYDRNTSDAFANESEMWLSKMLLDMHIKTMSDNLVRTDIYAKNFKLDGKKVVGNKWLADFKQRKLYSGEGATIQPGGCIVVAAADKYFEVSAENDNQLIYVALNDKFAPIAGSLPQGEVFYRNGSTDIKVIADGSVVRDNAQKVFAEGVCEKLVANGYTSVDYIESGAVGRLELLQKTIRDNNRPGIILLAYEPAANQAEEYTALLREAQERGICVLTYGATQLPESDVQWGVHFDAGMWANNAMLTESHGGAGVGEVGAQVAEYVLQIVRGEAQHLLLQPFMK